jgi:DNA-binding Xre family transcriptional regulator
MTMPTHVSLAGPDRETRVIVFRLAELLEDKGWSAYRLAKESGIPQPTVYRLLSDREDTDARISLRMLDKLCETLGCTVGELLEYHPSRRRGNR